MDKIRFGVRNLHIGTYTDSGGVITLGTGMAIPGAVHVTMEPIADHAKMYADNDIYYSAYCENGHSGEIEDALFSDEFKCAFLNYQMDNNGKCNKLLGLNTDRVWIGFESCGDVANRRMILYNVQLGGITREYATEGENTQPGTSTLPFTAYGDDDTNVGTAAFSEGDDYYANLFTAPPSPDDLVHFPLQDEDGLDLLTNDQEVIEGRVPSKYLIKLQSNQIVQDSFNTVWI